MPGRSTRSAAGSAALHSIENLRANPESPSPVEAPSARRHAVIISDDKTSPAPEFLAEGYDITWTSNLDHSLDDLPPFVDLVVLDDSVLRRDAATMGGDDVGRAGWDGQAGALDLDAVHQLGALLKRLTTRSRTQADPKPGG